MSESTPDPVPNHGPGQPGQDAHPGMPRWLKISAAIIAGVVLAVILVMLIAGAEHGPGRHSVGLGLQ